jgi:ArsR family transcriptional regulator
LKGLADPVRLRIVKLLVKRDSELCVCHLTGALALPQSTISRHLSILRNAGLVTTRRDGKWMHYSLSPAIPPEMIELVRHSSEGDETLREDDARLDVSLACD